MADRETKGLCEMSWTFLLFVQRGLSWAPFMSLSLAPFFLCGYWFVSCVLCPALCKTLLPFLLSSQAKSPPFSFTVTESRGWELWWGDRLSNKAKWKPPATWWVVIEGKYQTLWLPERESRCLNVVHSSGEMTLDLNPLVTGHTKLEARKNMMCWFSFVPKTLMSSQFFELLFLVLRIEPRALCMLD